MGCLQFNTKSSIYESWQLSRKLGPCQAAYAEAAKAPEFLKLMDDRGFTVMGIAGEEADKFLTNYRATSSCIVHNAGFGKRDPKEFGINCSK